MMQQSQQSQQSNRVRSALARAQQRLTELRAAEAAATQAREAGEKELEALQAEADSLGLGKKQQKTVAASSQAREENRPPHYEHYVNYDLSAWRSTTGAIMMRRAVPLSADSEASQPRYGEDGALLHWRRGLVGAVQDWAAGSEVYAIWLILKLIEHFGIKEAVLEKLGGMLRSPPPMLYLPSSHVAPPPSGAMYATAKVDACIVEQIISCLAVLRTYQTKQLWIECCIVLRACVPPPVAKGSTSGMASLVAKRLGDFWIGWRCPGPDGVKKPQMFTAAVQDRAVFAVEAAEAAKPKADLAAGDAVLCRGLPARLEWYDEATGHCGVKFESEGKEETVKFTSRFHIKGQSWVGCARLQRRQPSLMPPPQAQRSTALSTEVKDHVHKVYETTCPTSPHKKDERKRRITRYLMQVCIGVAA